MPGPGTPRTGTEALAHWHSSGLVGGNQVSKPDQNAENREWFPANSLVRPEGR